MSGLKNIAFIVLALLLVSFFSGCVGTTEQKAEPKADGKALHNK